MFFNKELCLFHIKPTNQNQLFEEMSQKLLNAECVKDSYIDGITKRESEYPTGLEVNGIGFAIPHTDSEHVIQSQVCFASLEEPIIFSDMTDKDRFIQVQLVFMLAMSSPHEQVDILQNLVELFQNQEKINQLLKCKKIDEFVHLINSAGVY